ncbi:serine/threonine-protein kinase chk2 [Microthyrium microscopicum]|uniref:Serine/threonine-protein kinase chk2 n=1 Tax=Microthyrium microscopicum TaxID=703497 RepID=A0A6A6U0L9_9PEZI|nr:serine/threonine-protein kinase chk2 [Microthyrium microscopicum]
MRRDGSADANGQSGDHISTPLKKTALPSPMTNLNSDTNSNTNSALKDGTISPPSPSGRQLATPSVEHQISQHAVPSQSGLDSQTQPFSQVIFPRLEYNYEVEDEEKEGVWGYLVPIDTNANKYGHLVLKDRSSCTPSRTERAEEESSVASDRYTKQEQEIEEHQNPSRGYIIGRHPECDMRINALTVSNRHCLFFAEHRAGNTYAMVEDTSANGTYVNDVVVGRNNRRELRDGDEVSIVDEARFSFRYPRHRASSAFKQQYVILDQLGKGHFATVYLCIDKVTGQRWAVKKFDRIHEKGRMDGLQQEIAVLMAISHPSLLCLKGAFEEDDGVYLILELAAEGELFNWIVMKQKLTEEETRKLFVQLFQAIKYLHERNIVHRDIKPENILLADKNLKVKLADFGLAKIIGEESFTTTLCGTPSYVAPEIIQPSGKRRYTKAVDIWSLGVVLYICLCGFPPFSDELCTRDNPYSLAQQIQAGRYDFPSPYWDSVGDPALDLIDKMLNIDPEKRYTVEECLEHPWLTGSDMGPATESVLSTDGFLASRLGDLDFSKKRPQRERTLLSEYNDVQVSKTIDAYPGEKKDLPPVLVFTKNTQASQNGNAVAGASGQRFLAMGENGDGKLFTGTEESSIYPEGEEFRKAEAKE